MTIKALLSGRLVRMTLAMAAVPVVLLSAVACGGDDDDEDPTSPSTARPSATASDGGGGGDEVTDDEVAIALKDNSFEPKDITVKVNEEVEITVTNEGAAVHNMHVLSAAQEGEDFKSDALVNPGQSSTFTVEFSKAGKVDFQCDYHLPDMVGTITVVD